MATNDLLKILGGFAAVSGAALGGFLTVIYVKFHKEIRTGEKIRAEQKLHRSARAACAVVENEKEPQPEMAAHR